jgi:hypothetical protein
MTTPTIARTLAGFALLACLVGLMACVGGFVGAYHDPGADPIPGSLIGAGSTIVVLALIPLASRIG